MCRLEYDPFSVTALGKPQKIKVHPLVAGPLRGGGVKAGPLRKKELFLKPIFLFCCH